MGAAFEKAWQTLRNGDRPIAKKDVIAKRIVHWPKKPSAIPIDFAQARLPR
jgi:hypothetical protein